MHMLVVGVVVVQEVVLEVHTVTVLVVVFLMVDLHVVQTGGVVVVEVEHGVEMLEGGEVGL